MAAKAEELVRRAGPVQLATLVKEPPAQADAYLYELKFDGYRILAGKSGGDVALFSRRGQDWTGEFGAVASAVAHLSERELVLDGEVCALDARGVPRFQLLQNRTARGCATSCSTS